MRSGVSLERPRRPHTREIAHAPIDLVVVQGKIPVGSYRSRLGVLGLAPHEKQGAAKQKNQFRPQFHSSPRSTS